MPPDLRQRFERLLLGLPEWEAPRDRRALIGNILRGHAIWEDLDLEGSPATAVVSLLDLADKHSLEPFCLLLAGLRDSDPNRTKEIDALEAELRSRRAQRRRETWKSGAPYRGLAYFDRKHAPIFFGREAEVDALIRTMTATEQGRRLTVVVGASGSGKSSLVRAGLWARLAEGQVPELPGSERWLISAMTPLELGSPALSLQASLVQAVKENDHCTGPATPINGIENLAELAERLLPKGGGARWLLILDQMEELFAHPDGAAFLDRLIEGTLRPASRLQVLATLRADFFQHCLQHPPLKRAVERDGGTFLLSAPGRLALERMVSGPVTELDLPPKPWVLDAALPAAMAADAERHPGGLALMAFALRELYDLCEPKRRMDLATYRSEAFGGLSGVIARRADATLQAFGNGGEAALQQVFVRLVRVNQDDAPTRRRARRSDWADDQEAGKLVDAFVNARLLVADGGGDTGQDPTIEVAHEALLREWPKLAGWIEQRREAFGLAERVRTEARAWKTEAQNRRPWSAEVIEEIRGKLASAGLLEQLQKEDAKVARLLTRELEWILAEFQIEAMTHARRREIGERLAEIGDPRRGVGVIDDGVPDILWRPIPAGGDVKKAFHIAAFPVTFAQFRAFLEVRDGYDKKRWWKDLEQIDRASAWQSRPANHPVTDVSWDDATAFCRWLTTRLGFEVRLPDEQEWQWAAQSCRTDFAYPWGVEWREGVANTSESEIRRTTAVGMYPQGDSLQGVLDLAGNVWEWCLNEYEESERTQPGGQESRVLRGGSWFFNREAARAGSRFYNRPDFRDYNIGFRVVCSSPIR